MNDRRAGIWIVAGLLAYALLGPASLLLVAWVLEPIYAWLRLDASGGTLGHSVKIALWPVAWGLLAAGLAVAVARWLRLDLRPDRRDVAVLGLALVLAGLVQLADMEWARARHGYYDPEHAGFVVFVPAALVAVGLAGWALLVGPRPARRALRVALVLAVAGLVALCVPSVPGGLDGIRPESVPVAATLTAAVTAAVAGGALILAHSHR